MWQLKNDFKSLFQQPKYGSIDGMRSISCLMIISIHLGIVLNAFIPAYPDPQWLTYLQTYSFRLSTLFTLSLETFFMLSGFLLTLKFIHHPSFFSWKNYPKYVLARACRFWPGILLVTIVMLLLGEANRNWTSLWLFYQNYVSIEHWSAGFGSMWSVSLDMQMHIILPVILHLVTYSQRYHRGSYIGLYILVVLSILYCLIIYDSKTMNVSVVICRSNPFALLMSQQVFDWIMREYNVTIAFDRPLYPGPFTVFMHSMYLPILSRYGSFIIGSILAFYLNDTKRKLPWHTSYLKKYAYFMLIGLLLFILITPGDPEQVSQVGIRIMFSILRQLFTLSQAFILFTTLCPPSHPYHSPWLKSLLSLRVWTPIAKLSYLVYVLHFRIAFELIMTQRQLFDPQRSSFDYLVLLCLGLVFVICLLVSAIWFVFVEKPFERFVTTHLWKDEKTHTN